MYYIYRHRRVDNNEVFYVGMGKKRSGLPETAVRSIYVRAYEKSKSRCEEWHRIIGLTDYDVEFVFDTEDFTLAQEKEREFIELHRDTICNQTVGGLGIGGYHHTEETRAKIAAAGVGRVFSEETKAKINARKYKPIIMIDDEDIEFEFDSLSDAALYLGVKDGHVGNISSCVLGKREKAYGFRFRYKEDAES